MATEPNLLSFLEMTLPHLQAALYSGETCIAGVSSPSVFSPTIQMRQLAIPAKEKVLLVSIGGFSLKLFGMAAMPFLCRDVGFLSYHRTVSLVVNLPIFLFSFCQ